MIDLIIQAQPNDETCGATSLHAIYQYYEDPIPLDEVIHGVEKSLSGGTLAYMLGKHALNRGYKATIYVYNVHIYDPTWFIGGEVESQFLMDKLKQQMHYKNDPYISKATYALFDYLKLGGTIVSKSLNVDLLKHFFEHKIPILTSLSSTYLYQCAREWFTPESESVFDDIRGTPCGHFVVLCGFDEQTKQVIVADPLAKNPLSNSHYYKVSVNRLINSIMLGVLTYDGNLLIIEPKIH